MSRVIRGDQPVAVITGATGGIGRWIALGMARAGHHLVVVGRNPERGAALQAWIAGQVPQTRLEFVTADLSLMADTRHAAAQILSRHPKIAVLINNAGAFDTRQVITAEGHNRVIATNLLAPLVLTQALLPALKAGAPARIVNVGSDSSDHAWINPDKLVKGRRWGMVRAYSQSKLAMMMTTFALAKKLDGSGVVANVVHPGLVASGLIRTGGIIGLAWRCMAWMSLTEEEGAATPVHAALSPEFGTVSGAYLKKCRAAAPNRRALDPVLVERVWAATLRLAGEADATAPASAG